MSNYFLEKIMDYIREGKIQISFSKGCGGETFLYYLHVYDVNTGKDYKFKIRRSDKHVIKFMIDVEGIENAFRC